ncbi:GNAT family N-acetyltransferase [Oscillospiraceae bacterium HV4-5-C5C]|nr:GNAT family N-acetyltransferase [Oscillospiraceae bacterium HV4-5-C5C]
MPCLNKAARSLDLSIRPAAEADLPEVLAVQRSAMRQYARNSGLTALQAEQQLEALRETVADLQAFLRQPGQVLLLARAVATARAAEASGSGGSQEGRVLGALRLQTEPGKGVVPGPAAYLTRFVVRPDCQSAGIGRALFDQACVWLKQQACQLVYLHTAAANPRSTRFYQSLGFRFVSRSFDRGYERELLCFRLPAQIMPE